MIYDFLVIGGGIAGASAAYELAAQGSVLLLKAESTMGYHATGRSAALFTRNYGGPVVRQIHAAGASFFRSPPLGFCETPLLTPRGCLTVSHGGHDVELDALLALSEPGNEICAMSPTDACTTVPFLRKKQVGRAVFEANVSDIDVATLLLSYLKVAKARGAVIITGHPITALSRAESYWHVHAANTRFSGKRIINAARAWADQTGAMAGALSIGLIAKRRTAIIIDGPNGLDCSAMPAIDFAGTDAYLIPDAGKPMASPGDATPSEPMDAWPDDMDSAMLADWIQPATPIELIRIDHIWAGLRSFVPDGTPAVGIDPEVSNFFWLAAKGGYGIMMAPVLVQLTADLCSETQGTNRDLLAQAVSPERLVDRHA